MLPDKSVPHNTVVMLLYNRLELLNVATLVCTETVRSVRNRLGLGLLKSRLNFEEDLFVEPFTILYDRTKSGAKSI